MSFLPFIAGSYGVTIGLTLVFATGAAFRLRRAKRRLLAVEAASGRVRA